MVCRLIDFALVVLKLLMFKGRGIIGISKIEFFNFSGTERLKVKKFHSPSAIIEHFEKHSILRLSYQIEFKYFGKVYIHTLQLLY